MLRKLGLSMIFAVATLAARSATADLYSGRMLSVSVSGSFFHTYILQQPSETWTITTSNLSPNSDTVLHVQDLYDPQGSYIAGNDDYAFPNLASQVVVPPVGYARWMHVIVRSYSQISQGTCDLIATGSQGGQIGPYFSVAFGGSTFFLANLSAGTHVTTVERQGGFQDLEMLTVGGPGFHYPGYGVAWDDNDGVGGSPLLHNNEACTTCGIVLGITNGTGPRLTDIVWDADVDWADFDGDGLGDSLEHVIGTIDWARDTDDDGLEDGKEVLGYEEPGSSTAVKLPTWGADPLQKDMFIEFDWKQCMEILDPAKCPQGADSGKMGAGILSDADFQTQVADKLELDFEGNIRFHLDIGRTNTNPVTWFYWGNWGGASLQSTVPGVCGEEGNDPARAYYFHHSVSYPPEGTDPPGGNLGITCAMPGPFFRNMRNSVREISHELGHGLGLYHGGRPFAGSINYKPHYISIMNYVYANDMPAPRSFSHGNSVPVPTLNPTALDETIGLGPGSGPGPDWTDQALKTFVLTKLRDTWCPVTPYSSGNCVDLQTGKVDWNRDGVFETSARGAVSESDFSWVRQSAWTGTAKLKDPAMTWVGLTYPVGNELFVFGRNQSNQFVWAKTSGTALNAGCSGPFSSFYENEPECAGFGTPGSATLVSGEGSATLTVAPGAAEYGSSGVKQILVVFQRNSGYVKSKLVTLDSTGYPSFGSDVQLPGFVVATGDITAVAVSPTEVRAYARKGSGSSARLAEWKYLSGSWVSGPTDQQWSDNTYIVPTFGIGATRGYQDGSSTAKTYAAIPTYPYNLVEFVRKDPDGKWSKVTFTCTSGFGCVGGTAASSWAGTGGWGLAPGGTQPRADARPGLAYQKRGGQPNNYVGRFYMAINQATQCSGPFYAPGPPAQCPSALIMTEGNQASGNPTTKRLTWIQPPRWLAPQGAIGGISLMQDLTRDANLRAAFADQNTTGLFQPLADGIVNANLSDMDDFVYVTGGLGPSICFYSGTWWDQCVLPPWLP